MTDDVWLEIRDDDGPALNLSLRWRVRETSGDVQVAFQSPWSSSTRELLRRYAREFRSWRPQARELGATAERTTLTVGRALGNALVDEGYQLLEFCRQVEREGIEKLRVVVQVADPRLAELPWEAMLLPDSDFVTAAAAAAFMRSLPGLRPLAEVRRRGLGAAQPLRYLRIQSSEAVDPPSLDLALAWRQLGWDGALHHRRGPLPARSEQAGEPWQIVHWSGSNPEQDLPDLVERVRPFEPDVLILESGGARGDVLDATARAALEAGIDNVIVMNAPAGVWGCNWLEDWLDGIRAGWSVGQAVVEARKKMQRAFLDARQAERDRPHAPQLAHALRHYSGTDVVFFEAALATRPFESTESHGELRRSLFGFRGEFLPPRAADLGDSAALQLMNALCENRPQVVNAARGGGLTHALHRSALLSCANHTIDRAYYWDFAAERFQPSDLVQMVSSARGHAPPEGDRIEALLELGAGSSELYVFDNLDALLDETDSSDRLAAIGDFARRIAAGGARCILAAHADVSKALLRDNIGEAGHVTLPALSEVESIALLYAVAPAAVALGRPMLALLDQLEGNPLLVRRVLARCTEDNVTTLLAEARDSYGRDGREAGESAVECLHAERWRRLEAPWRALLGLCLPLAGLPLQLLMIAVDRPEGQLSERGRALWQRIGAGENTNFSAALARCDALGFVVASASGSSVDPAALRFLRAREPELELASAARDLVAELACDGFLRLLERLNPNEHAALYGELLAHRAAIRDQLQRSLQAGQHAIATRAFFGMHGLLQRAGLAGEASAWARSLIEAAGPALCTHPEAAAKTAWLGLALRAQLDARPPFGPTMELGVRHWRDWLEARGYGDDASARAIVPLVVAFLEQAYDQRADYLGYRAVARLACDHYRATDNPTALVAQLLSLSAAEHTLGNASARDELETELLSPALYRTLPNGGALRERTLETVAGMRLRRADLLGGEALIERLETEAGEDPPCEAGWRALALRAELAVQREQFELAVELTCRLWSAAMSGKRAIDISRTGTRLLGLAQRVEPARYQALYDLHCGDTPTPQAMGLDLGRRPPG